jgi:hypothetical protein
VPAATEHPLRRHPASCCAAVRTIAASAGLAKDGALLLSYDVRGKPGRISIPETRPSGAADGLWRHTCCEAFVAAVDAPEYREFNFSPSGQWAAYRFSAYRNRDSGFVPPAAPQLDCRSDAAGFRVTARIAPELLPAATALNIGLSAVIETADGARSYWALAHTGAQPDFHHRQCFTLTLIRP